MAAIFDFIRKRRFPKGDLGRVLFVFYITPLSQIPLKNISQHFPLNILKQMQIIHNFRSNSTLKITLF